MNETKETLVIIEITDDDARRSWWEALGLPCPIYWDDALPQNVSVRVIHETERTYARLPSPA